MNKGATEMSNSMALPPGTELGEYTIIRKLGQGGFGITYLARDNNNNCDVVIKENLPSVFAFRSDTCLSVRPHSEGEPEDNYRWALQRFCDEAQTINRLSHPNIVKVLRAFKALGTAYYVMPYVKGESLSNIYKTSAQVTGEWLLTILKPILSALSYLHSQGVMHRDLKPANILIKDEETPILIDFGAARSYISERSATLVGTPGYSPVEQVTPNGKCGPWTDLYALGATCYRLIKDETPPDALSRVYNTDPYVPLSSDSALCGRYPRELLKTIDKALRIDASKRWQTADEWLAALSPARMKKGSSGGSLATTAAIVALLATAGGSAWYYYSNNGQMPSERVAQVRGQEEATPPQSPAEEQVNTHARARLGELGIVEAEYNTKLGEAADNNDNEKIGLLIAAGADVNFDMADDWTPLTTVCLNQNLVGLQLLLDAPGIDVNKQNRHGDTALIWAAVKGHLEGARLLLAVPGININYIDNDGKTAYDWAVANNHEECAQLIRNNGGKTAAEIQGSDRQISTDTATAKTRLQEAGIMEGNYNEALCQATDNSDNEKIRLLIDAGADVNCDATDGFTPITNVCLNGNTEGLRMLLAAPGIDVNQPNKRGDNAIIWAAVRGHTECLRMLLAVPGINVNFIDSDNKTAIDWASENNHAECVKLLQEAGGRTNNSAREEAQRKLQSLGISPSQYNEAICKATDNGDNEKLRLLIAAGADVNSKAEDGWSPLTNLCYYDNQEGLRFILSERSLDVNASDGKGNNALTLSAAKGRLGCLRQLLAHSSIQVNECDANGRLPLIQAVAAGHLDCVLQLMNNSGLDINARNRDGDTALIWAAAKGNIDILKALLRKSGIDLDVIDGDGKTAYDWAVSNNHTECAEVLRNAGARTAAQVRSGGKTRPAANTTNVNTQLCNATDNGDNSKIRQALAAGADVNCDADDGWTPLTNVAFFGHEESMRILLGAPGIDVNKLNNKGNHALVLAAQKGHSSCIRLLLAAPGIDVNLQNEKGDTALIWAAVRGNTECLRLLLAAPGININYVDRDGCTALDWAEKNNQTECARLLREAGAKKANQL